jgi:D-alanyl-D-alanine carboxypeptidase
MERVNRRGFLRLMGGGAAYALGCGLFTAPVAAAPVKFDASYFDKLRRFNEDHATDVCLNPEETALLKEVTHHLRRVQSTVGYGNFGVVGFEQMLRIGTSYSSVGPFRADELEFLERIFYDEGTRYGFYGEKVLTRITDEVPERALTKAPGCGQFVYRGKSLDTFREMKAAIGDDLIFTSGVRGVVKQMYLFLNKAVRTNGNLSRASRSLAPPGYSFHGVGDFDVGKRGLGRANFTEAFAETDIHARLVELGYATLRYPAGNLQGVRYEPWHIKVV